jgi:hypothetical protein
MENGMAIPHKTENRVIPLCLAMLLLVFKELKAGHQTDICAAVFIAALFTIA